MSRTEELYSKNGKTMQVIIFKNDKKEGNSIYLRIPTTYDPAPKWLYVARFEFPAYIKGWKKQ
jgi:hypothetical protein